MEPENKTYRDPLKQSVPSAVAWVSMGVALIFSLAVIQVGFSQFEAMFSQVNSLQYANEARLIASQRAHNEAPPQAIPLDSTASDRIIIGYKDRVSAPGLEVAAERANLERAEGLQKLFSIDVANAVVYRVHGEDSADEVVNRILMNKRGAVEYAEVDMLMALDLTPNDPRYGNAWHLPKIAAPEAWDLSLGGGVVIAILDTGVDNVHVDLVDDLVQGWNSVSQNSDLTDLHGHGTRVIGAASAVTDNATGVAAVGFNAKVMPIRVSERTDGHAYWSDMTRGLYWAADNGAHVASMSYQSWRSSSVQNAAKYMRDKGGIVFASAGNDGTDTGYAATPYIIVVSATNSSDTRPTWSNFGAYVDLSAPGVSIQTTSKGNAYSSVSGTSFSSPIAAAVAALMLGANPALTSTQMENILFSTADDLGVAGWDPYYGHGRVNAARAVSVAMATAGARDTTPPTVPGSLRVTDISSKSVSIAWNASSDDVAVSGYVVYRDGNPVTTVSGTTHTDTGLMSETMYVYTVAAEDTSANMSAMSNEVSVTTEGIEFAIENHAVTAKSASDATIGVALTKPGTVTVQYGTDSKVLNQSVSGSVLDMQHSVTLTGLREKTTYYYQVVAVSETGVETFSNVSNFKTSALRGGGKPRSR